MLSQTQEEENTTLIPPVHFRNHTIMNKSVYESWEHDFSLHIPTTDPSNPPLDHPMNYPLNHSMNHSLNYPMNYPMNQSMDHPMDHPMDPLNHSINQSIDRPVEFAIDHFIEQPSEEQYSLNHLFSNEGRNSLTRNRRSLTSTYHSLDLIQKLYESNDENQHFETTNDSFLFP